MNEQRIRAPELPADLEWFNTDNPVKLADQRGMVVLLDFWTYSCINCMHVLADLQFLEEKYREGLTVIGIHSPKFPREQVGGQVQKAINRCHIRHAVANDPSLSMWKQYGIRAWPSIVFIDPEGYAVGVVRGEGRRRQLDTLIAEHLSKAEAAGIRPTAQMRVKTRPEAVATLLFPGKVHATANRIYIADSGHNRIIEATHNGQVRRVFGATGAGLVDGRGEEAAFRNPQGMVRLDDYLYVADTGNHAIRRIELGRGEVHTVAGTGRQGRYQGFFYEDPLQAPLNSPWDLAYADGSLYIAMAGQHQIWRLHLINNVIGSFVGSGREEFVDGAAKAAGLAQPMGLALGAGQLFFADAEASAVRSARLPDGEVHSLVGAGLFEFGDQDGPVRRARLQHPMALACDGGAETVWVADTYNNKVKRLDLGGQEIASFGECAGLDEPGGLSLQGTTLWIANTNAHEIRRMDLTTGTCQTVQIHE